MRDALATPTSAARSVTSSAFWRERSRASVLMSRISSWIASGWSTGRASSLHVAHHLRVLLQDGRDLFLLRRRQDIVASDSSVKATTTWRA